MSADKVKKGKRFYGNTLPPKPVTLSLSLRLSSYIAYTVTTYGNDKLKTFR